MIRRPSIEPAPSAPRPARYRVRSRRLGAALGLLVAIGTPPSGRAQEAVRPPAPGEVEWTRGHEAAQRGDADAAIRAYREALAVGRRERDEGLASAARLGMAEVFDVWYRCADSARVAYEEATALAGPGDFAAALGRVRWLARQGEPAVALDQLRRTFESIDTDVPRTVTHESVEYLTGLAAVQRARRDGRGALSSLLNARDIAGRLLTGADTSANGGVTEYNFWVLHDLAMLRLDAEARGARAPAAGRALRDTVDAAFAAGVPDDGAIPRFSAARLADRVARARRACGDGPCPVPAPPTKPRCP